MSDPTCYRYPDSPSWDQIRAWVSDGAGRAVLKHAIAIWEFGPEAGPNLRIFVDDASAGFLNDVVKQRIEDQLSDNPEGIVIRAVLWEIGSRRAYGRHGGFA